MNPMIRKELNLRMRERRGWILPSLYLVALCVVVIFTYYESTRGRTDMGHVQGAEVGAATFIALSYTQLTLLLILAPVFSAGALTIEKEQRTLAGLITSLLSPAEIWAGKLSSAVMFVALLLCTGLPVMALAMAFGGVGPMELIFSVLTIFFVVITVAAMGLYFSATFRRSVHSTAVAYGVVILLSVITFIVFALLYSHWQSSHLGVNQIPLRWRAPLYLNPYYFLTVSFGVAANISRAEWFYCLMVYGCLGISFSTLAIRAIDQSGEQI